MSLSFAHRWFLSFYVTLVLVAALAAYLSTGDPFAPEQEVAASVFDIGALIIGMLGGVLTKFGFGYWHHANVLKGQTGLGLYPPTRYPIIGGASVAWLLVLAGVALEFFCHCF